MKYLKFSRYKHTKYLLISCLVFLSFSTRAQIQQEDRIEIPITRDYSLENLYNFRENGFVISTKQNKQKSKTDPDRIYRLYNTNFEEVSSYELNVPFRQKTLYSYEGRNSLFTMHFDRKFKTYTLVELKVKNGSLVENRLEGKLKSRTYIYSMFSTKNYTVLDVKAGFDFGIYTINNKTGKEEFHPLAKIRSREKHRLLDYNTDANEENAYLLYEVCRGRNKCQRYVLYKLDKDGEWTQMEIAPDENNVRSATITHLGANKLLVAGTCTERRKGYGSAMFVCMFDQGEQQYFKVYPFTEFDRFFDYMDEYQRRRLEKVKKRRKARGKSLNYSTRMVMHEAIDQDSAFTIIGEAYYPTYRTVTTTDANGNVTRTQVFDGYQYSHASVVSFTFDGEKVYDNSFRMFIRDKPYYVRKYIEVRQEDSEMKLIFADDRYIETKVFKDGEVLEEEKSSKIETGSSNDKVKSASGFIEYWYDQYFISYGYNKIKNRVDKDKKRKRKVFYIQKIAF